MRILKILKVLCVMTISTVLCSCGMSSQTKEMLNQKVKENYIESTTNDIKIEKVSENYFKTNSEANPLSSDIFCADPTSVEYEGRLYVFGTNDHQQYEEAKKNTYEKIKSLVIFSTEDMVNWTYHGKIDVKAIAPWIINSWAPSIVSRVENDGQTHFYLYFSNSGCGVGVITATNPLGPWTDPVGKPLVSTSTPGLKDCPNPFDPGVCIDENGDGWLSFGGGKASNGSNYMPGVSRVVKLGKDMISFDSDFVEIKAPYFFEASELNYINGTYVYTYNNSWEPRIEWEMDGVKSPSACSMSYMTTKTPLVSDSWEYKGDYFLNPGDSGLDYSNNHSNYIKYKDKYYIFHHSMLRQSNMKISGGFRSIGVVDLAVDEDKVEITPTKPSKEGVTQIQLANASSKNEAETVFRTAGIEYEYNEVSNVSAIKSNEKGSWIHIKGMNFDKKTSSILTAMVKGKGRVEVRLDSLESDSVAAIEFDSDNYQGVYSKVVEKIKGTHDVYLVFSDENISLDYWQFI